MKSKILISYLLLSTLILTSLSTTVQAAEYREVNTEVKAEDILEHIEGEDDIYLDNCRIIGELNINTIKLETIPNPAYYKFMKNGFDTEMIFDKGFSENLLVIKSNLTIKNSIFENSVSFSNAMFKKPVSFQETSFNNVNFVGAVFNNSADFSRVSFYNSTYFSIANFNDNTYFLETNFDNDAYFTGTSFNGSADFSGAIFNNLTYFSNAYFNNSTYFYEATFNGDAYFTPLVSRVVFKGDADFSSVTFRNSADFSEVDFKSNAYFSRTFFSINNSDSYSSFGDSNFSSADFTMAEFYGNAYFSGSNFGSAWFNEAVFYNLAVFSGVNFKDTAEFFRVTFNSHTDFSLANCGKDISFNYVIFNSTANFDGPSEYANIITNDAKVCQLFQNYYKNTARYVAADNVYFNYRKECQEEKDWHDSSKWLDIICWITCGYGVRPSHTIYFVGFLILLFSFIYAKGPSISLDNSSRIFYLQGPGIDIRTDSFKNQPQKIKVSFWDALNFSISTFTTVGYGNWYPKENFKKWATLEGLLGYVMLGVFMSTLTTVMIRT